MSTLRHSPQNAVTNLQQGMVRLSANDRKLFQRTAQKLKEIPQFNQTQTIINIFQKA
jgi:hypothetical protein